MVRRTIAPLGRKRACISRSVLASVSAALLSLPLLVAPAYGASSSNLKSVATGGIGSTGAEMKALHNRARGPGLVCSASNSCFGGALKNDESGNTFLFTGVDIADGVVIGYNQNFVRGTSFTSAISQILRWLPKDSKVGKLTIDHIGGSCGLFNVISATLAKVLSAPRIGDPKGVVGIDLEYVTASLNIVYNPNNVEDAVVTIGPVQPKDSC